MKKLTKILIILLSVALLCTGLVMVISANGAGGNVAMVGTTEYATLADALAAVKETGGTVKLINDADMEEAYTVSSDITIDLAGYTLTTESTFTVNKSVTFTITGYGDIVANNLLIKSETSGTTPTVNIVGTKSKINITMPDDAIPKLVSNSVGVYNFTNIKFTATKMTSAGAFAMTAASKETASFNFKASEIYAAGPTSGGDALIYLQGLGTLNIDSSHLQSEATTVSIKSNNSTDSFISVNNSYLKTLQTSSSIQCSVFGQYQPFYGTIKVKNSVIDSSYRPFMFQCPSVDETKYPNMKILLEGTTVYMNGFLPDALVRHAPLYMDSACKVIYARPDNGGSTVAVSGDGRPNPTEGLQVYVQEGMRTNSKKFANLTEITLSIAGLGDVQINHSVIFPDGSTNGVKDKDGNITGASTTYRFVYDPVGDPYAPYVVAKISGDDAQTDYVPTIGNADYTYAGGTDGYFPSQPGNGFVIVDGKGDLKPDKLPEGTLYNGTKLWLNQVGKYSHIITQNADGYFAYHATADNLDYPLDASGNHIGPSFVFGQPLNGDNKINDAYKLVIYEFDIATDTGKFTEMMLSIALNEKEDASGADRSGTMYLTIKQDGTIVCGSDISLAAGVEAAPKLSVKRWNRVAVVLNTVTGAADIYVNDTHAFTGTGAYKSGACLMGVALDVEKAQPVGTGFLFDNLVVRAFAEIPEGVMDYEQIMFYPAIDDATFPSQPETNQAVFDGTQEVTPDMLPAGSLYNLTALWKNFVGKYTNFVGENIQYFVYNPTDSNLTAPSIPNPDPKVEEPIVLGPGFVFGQPIDTEKALNELYTTLVYEFDLGTNTELFTEMVISIAANSKGDGTGYDRAGLMKITVGQDGTVSCGEGTVKLQEGDIKLSKDSFNNIKIVIDTTTEDSGYAGTAVVYINGTAAFKSTKAYADDAFVLGVAIDVAAKQPTNSGFTFDNLSISEIHSKAAFGHSMNTDPVVGLGITVGPIEYETLEGAMADAEALGTHVSINSNVSGILIDKNVLVFANGYTIDTASGSNNADIIFGKDGEILAYEYNEAYNELGVKYYWFHGDINDPNQYLHPEDERYWSVTDVGMGSVPKAPSGITISDTLNMNEYYAKIHAGWDNDGDGKNPLYLRPICKADVENGKDGIYMYPSYEYHYFTAYVEKSDNTVKYISGDGDIVELLDYFKVAPGSTLRLLSDFKLDKAPEIEFATAGTYNFDFAGNTLYVTAKGNVFNITAGVEFNVYSSVSGGMMYAIELKESEGGSRVGAGTFINVNDDSASAVVNIGAVGENDGANLTLAGDCIVEASSGVAVNIDGATVIRVAFDKEAAVLLHKYNGTVNVNNTAFILPTGSPVVSCDAKEAVGCNATFKDCKFVFASNGANDIVKKSSALKSLTFEGCLTNGKLNATAANVVIGNGNAAFDFAVSDGYTYLEGLKKVGYNVAMDAPAVGESDFFDANVAGGAFVAKLDGGVIRIQRWGYSPVANGAVGNGYLYIYPNGYEGDRYEADGDAAVELPVISHKITNDYVTVTYKNTAGDVVGTELYAKGANLVSTDGITLPAEEVMTALKVVNNGKWNVSLPVTNLTENLELIPEGSEVVVNLDDIKVSVSLYTDFAINVYIPASYVPYITALTYGDKAIETEEVSKDGVDYIKLTVRMPAYAASADAVITVSVTENDKSAVGTITMSIADYAAKVIENANGSENDDVKLVRYMAAYAYEAAEYFISKTDRELLALVGNTKDYEVNTSADISELSSVISSITLDLGCELSAILTVKDDFIGTVTVLGSDYVFDAESERVIVLKGLSFADFAMSLPIIVCDADGTVVSDSSYALFDAYTAYHIEAAMNGNSTSTEAYAIVKALYNYVKFSEYYKAIYA